MMSRAVNVLVLPAVVIVKFPPQWRKVHIARYVGPKEKDSAFDIPRNFSRYFVPDTCTGFTVNVTPISIES